MHVNFNHQCVITAACGVAIVHCLLYIAALRFTKHATFFFCNDHSIWESLLCAQNGGRGFVRYSRVAVSAGCSMAVEICPMTSHVS